MSTGKPKARKAKDRISTSAKEAGAARHREPLPEFVLINGVGDYSKGTACVVSAAVAKWRFDHGEPLDGATDELDCIDPCVRRLAIRINDADWWENDRERTEVLSPFISRLAGTRNQGFNELRDLIDDYEVRHRIESPAAADATAPDAGLVNAKKKEEDNA